MSLFLFETPLSPFVEKVMIALAEKGLDCDKRVPAGIGVGIANELLVANPRSEAPALIDGEVVVFDSTIILEYLDDRFPDCPLRPAGAAARARVRMIEEICDTHYEAVNWGLYELNFFKRGGKEGTARQLFAAARSDLAILHDWLETQLGTAEWFAGTQFGLADIVVAPFIEGSRFNGIELAPERPLGRWFARAKQRPSVAAAFARSQEGSELLHSVAGALEQGLLKRHYRDHRLEWIVRGGGLSSLAAGLAADNVRFTDLSRLSALPRLATG